MPGPRMLTHKGETLTVKEWAYRTGHTVTRLHHRLGYGWSIARTLETPAKPYRTMAQALEAYLTQQEETRNGSCTRAESHSDP